MTLHKAFDGEVYYWWDDDRQQASKVQPKKGRPILTNDKDHLVKHDDDLARFVLRQIRGCATDDQYIETLERVKTALTTTRLEAVREARAAVFREAFKVLCPDCAEGDEPTLDQQARWCYHGEGKQQVGCSASKLRIEAAGQH